MLQLCKWFNCACSYTVGWINSCIIKSKICLMHIIGPNIVYLISRKGRQIRNSELDLPQKVFNDFHGIKIIFKRSTLLLQVASVGWSVSRSVGWSVYGTLSQIQVMIAHIIFSVTYCAPALVKSGLTMIYIKVKEC